MTLAILAVFSVALTLLGFVLPPQGVKRATLLGLALALASLLLTWGKPFAFGPYAVDGISQVFTLLALLGALWTVGLVRSGRFEFYLLVLYAALGMHLLASTRHLLLMLVALEALSLPLYALATWRRGQGLEAALKYFLLGAFDAPAWAGWTAAAAGYGVMILLKANLERTITAARRAETAPRADVAPPLGGFRAPWTHRPCLFCLKFWIAACVAAGWLPLLIAR